MSLAGGKNVRKNQVYITAEERRKCQRVAEAFAGLYDQEDILVLDAGKYGFLKLQYYQEAMGFEDVITYTNSQSLFESLWKDWFYTQLLDWARDTPILEMEYEDIYKCMPPKKQKELIRKKNYLKKKCGLIEKKKTLRKNQKDGVRIKNILIARLYWKIFMRRKRYKDTESQIPMR